MSDSTLRTGVHRIELVVRDHELDQYGVVNNAVYPQYLEVARADLLHQIGVDTNAVAAEGRSLALAELSLRFLSPLRGKMRFVVETQLSRLTVARAVYRQCVFALPWRTAILEAEAMGVFLDARGRPVRMEKWVREALACYLVSDLAPHLSS